MTGLELILCGTELTISIAKFTGLIKNRLQIDIDRLKSSELEAGLRALEQAATSTTEQKSLLREARYRLNKAISLEKDFRLGAAHIGLALCHSALSDFSNAQKQLKLFATMDAPSIPFWLEHLDADSYWLSDYIVAAPLHWLEWMTDSKRKRKYVEALVANFTALQKEADWVLERSFTEGAESVFRLVKT